jgi:hypothetical protein
MTATVTVTEAEARRAVARLTELPEGFVAQFVPAAYVVGWRAALTYHEEIQVTQAALAEARSEYEKALESGDDERVALSHAKVEATKHRLDQLQRSPIGAPARCDLHGVQRELDHLRRILIPARPRALSRLREENLARAGRQWNGIDLKDLDGITHAAVELIDQWRALVSSARRWAAAQPGVTGSLANPHDGPRAIDHLEALARVIQWGRDLERRAGDLGVQMKSEAACQAMAGSVPIRLDNAQALERAAA